MATSEEFNITPVEFLGIAFGGILLLILNFGFILALLYLYFKMFVVIYQRNGLLTTILFFISIPLAFTAISSISENKDEEWNKVYYLIALLPTAAYAIYLYLNKPEPTLAPMNGGRRRR